MAEQIEAAHKAALAKGEVGIRERKIAPTLAEFAEEEFLPFIETRFAKKPKTLEYYKTGLKHLKEFPPLAKSRLDAIEQSAVTDLVDRLRAAELQVSSVNRILEVLRRMVRLSLEWGKLKRSHRRSRCSPAKTNGTAY